jgi:hypothetical protein
MQLLRKAHLDVRELDLSVQKGDFITAEDLGHKHQSLSIVVATGTTCPSPLSFALFVDGK